MAAYTGDQVMVQRFQTTRSLDDSRRAYVVNAAGDAIWMFGLSFVGLALLAYFNHNPLPADLAPDKVLPYFISRAFPVGAVGLVIAAILAASLSSIDSAINSCTSVMMVDGYERLFRRPDAARGGPGDVVVARVLTVAFGAAGTILATNVSRIGTLLEIAQKLINAFSGPLFGIYLLAMFSRRATAGPVLVGGIAGSLTSYYVAYHSGIGFMWPSTFGLTATIVVGWILTQLTPARPSPAALRLTWREVMRIDREMDVEHVRHLR
jgi:SSS family solute:Na+ symporter